MQQFAALYQQLDSTTKTTERLAALVRYFREAPPEDAAWCVWFLCGERPRRAVSVGQLQEWCAGLAGIPEWLFEISREFVGDLAETIALLLPAPTVRTDQGLHYWVVERLLPLGAKSPDERREAVLNAWNSLAGTERFLFNKLLTGGFRVGVSRRLVIRGLADFWGLPADVIAHRRLGPGQPTAEFCRARTAADTGAADVSRPYPCCRAHPLSEDDAAELSGLSGLQHRHTRLGAALDWILEWKWDGIRAQVIRRGGRTFIWSRGEELLTDRFPELERVCSGLPDGTVLDGEITAWQGDRLLPFAELQKRIHRRSVTPRLLATVPVRFIAFDLLEQAGVDLRQESGLLRRGRLEEVLWGCAGAWPQLQVAPRLSAGDWEACLQLRQSCREQRVEGLMLKHVDAVYETGRVVGAWWKWKIEPFHCDAVLLYAQRGHGRRAGKYTDFTFGVRSGDTLVPFAKAYSGLTNAEIEEVDRFIRDNTLERFGPVSSVRAELVFELAFEGLQLSPRHKSGIAVRFPRISRWRRDKTVADIDSLETLRELIRSRQVADKADVSGMEEAAGSAEDLSTGSVVPAAGPRRGRQRKQSKSAEQAAIEEPKLGGLFAGLDD
ncbi:MAG: ATP-dependent DNA ligase [Planctomyces sp.]